MGIETAIATVMGLPLATKVAASMIALEAGSQVAGGVMGRRAYNEEATSNQQRAAIAQSESVVEARQKQLEVNQVAARQAMAFAKNGVLTDEGSPLLTMSNTINLGREEVEAINRRGVASVNYYNSLAKQSKNQGRAALIGGIGKASSSVFNGYLDGKTAGIWGQKKVNPNLVDSNAFSAFTGTMYA